MNFGHLLLHWLGLDSASGPVYLAWSGAVGDIGLIAAVLIFLRRHNCPHRWCWRLGRHPVADGLLHTCRRHSPVSIPRRLTMEHIHALHRAHHGNGTSPGVR